MATKANVELPDSFVNLLRAAQVPIQHLQPKQTSSIATTITADTSDIIRGLAKAYDVMPRDIIRAALVIGIEELLGCAEELGHATQAPPN